MNPELSSQLDQIEAEMKRIGFWQENPPDLAAKFASGEMRTYLDAPSFELWLQTIFLPNARRAVENNSFPRDSQVGLMAMRQWDYQTSLPEAQTLIRLLSQFDDLVRRENRGE
jgi:uncharacterized protein YqcC (DUF446 family)